MNRSFDDSKMFEQVSSRATKPDESRKKSLYFLLLAIGRQRAATNPSLRVKYRAALNSLQINKVEDCWKIELTVDDKVISRELKRNAFKFYSTGLNQLEDNIVQSNTTAAREFWESVESDLMHIPTMRSDENSKASTARFLFDKMRTASFFPFVISLLLLAPYLPTSITFLTLFLFPTLILTWSSSRKVNFSLMVLSAILIIPLDVEGFQDTLSSALSWHVLLFLIAWHEFRRIQSQRNFRSLQLAANLVLLLGLFMLSLSTISSYWWYLLLVSLALFSELMRKLRKYVIDNTPLVVTSVIGEVSISLLLCTYLFMTSSAIEEAPAITLILLFSVYVVWFVYFNVNERFAISLRFLFPAVILCATNSHALNLVEFITAFTVVLMIFVNSVLQRSEKC